MRSGRPNPVQEWKRRLKPVRVDGLRTFVLDEGLGDPVLFLHGIPTQAFLWRDTARVVARYHRAVAPDLLGFGFADKPASADLSPAGQAAFIRTVLDELGAPTCAVVAHDYGALVAAELLATVQERVERLVLLNTSLWREDWAGDGFSPFALVRHRGIGELAFALARPFMLTAALKLYVEEDDRLTRDAMAVYWQPFEEGFGRVLLNLFRNRALTEDDFCRWRDALAAFRRPALIVWGGRDPTFIARRGRELATLIPGARFELFEHANHFVPEDRPEALGRLIDAFLRETPRP